MGRVVGTAPDRVTLEPVFGQIFLILRQREADAYSRPIDEQIVAMQKGD